MSTVLDELNKLAENLDAILAKKSAAITPGPDAIDRVLAEAPRKTEVVSIRDSAEMEAFQTAVVDGLIANDAARQLLSLVNTVLTKVLVV